MAKLILRDKFILEIPKTDGENDIIKGTLRKLTKQEMKQIQDNFKSETDKARKLIKNSTKLKKIAKKIERLELQDMDSENIKNIERLENEFDSLELILEAGNEELQEMDVEENANKQRLEMSISEDAKVKILSLGATYGYKIVLDKILEGVEEGKSKE